MFHKESVSRFQLVGKKNYITLNDIKSLSLRIKHLELKSTSEARWIVELSFPHFASQIRVTPIFKVVDR